MSFDGKTAPVEGQFFLCEKCRVGQSPNLCVSCRHNIDVVEQLQQSVGFLKKINLELRAEIGVLNATKEYK